MRVVVLRVFFQNDKTKIIGPFENATDALNWWRSQGKPGIALAVSDLIDPATYAEDYPQVVASPSTKV